MLTKKSEVNVETQKEVEEKFKFMEGEVRKLSLRVEMMYDSINNKIEKINDVERKIGELAKTIYELEERIDRNKEEILSKTNTENINSRADALEERMAAIEFEQRRSTDQIKEIIKKIPGVMGIELDDLVDRIIFLESRLRAMERSLEESAKAKPLVLE